jgi:DNA-directed RNA polymerase II subunit RPB1
LRRGVAVLLTLLLAAASAVAVTPAAQAATPGITASMLLNGETYQGTPVVNEGDTVTLRVQYSDQVVPGSTVQFELGPNVTLTGVPQANTAIQSVTQVGNKVSITFKDPWPAGVNQGVFDLNSTVNAVTHSVKEPITWTVDGDQSQVEVIIRHSGDQFANVTDGSAKAVSPTNLDSYVTVVGGKVQLKPTITSAPLTYTLTLNSPNARTAFPITDQLPAGLSYTAGSFSGQLTSWDSNGLNRTTSAFPFTPVLAGNSFTGSVDVPGPSILKLTYQATVTDVAALESALQTQYDALGGASGNFQISLTNTAGFGSTKHSASVRLRGTVAGVNLGAAFGKTASWSTKDVVTKADGSLTPPADITYTLKADLRQWTGANPNFTLGRNVVITDPLPTQATWNTADPAFLTSTGITLTQVACPATPADFAADSYVGDYCVDGQTLRVNVGKDNTTNAQIMVKAQLNTVTGLTQSGSTPIVGAVPYQWRNTATFDYRNGAPYSVNRDVTVVQLPDTSNGLNNPDAFAKNGVARSATIQPGQSAVFDYTFSGGAGYGIDLRTSKIVDYVDSSVFDLGDLSGVDIHGKYDGQTLAASDFALSKDANGDLVIQLSTSGKAIVTARGADKAYAVTITLTTVPFEGKQTKTIKNRATLFGSDGNPQYWSETSSQATSYGNEAEVQKQLFDNTNSDWTHDLAVHMDGHGNLVRNTFVYRIDFIPHGSYNNVVIVPVIDNLPGAVAFLGFVNAADAATGANPVPGPVAIGGNLIATYDALTHQVTLEQKPGTLLDAGSPITAYFAVKVTDASGPIQNRIGSTYATITPLKSVSVGDFVWVDTNRDGRQSPGEPGIPGVVLTLTGPGGGPVTDVNGNPVGPVTTDANGKYLFPNLPALSGNQTYTVHIDQAASAQALAPYVPTRPGVGDRAGDSSTWTSSTQPGDLQQDGDKDLTLDFGFVTKTYAIGDYVWIDSNHNGIQDKGEKPLAGVQVDLLQNGKVIAKTTTDANGRYLFDDLPAGSYQVRFTLTPAQQKIYKFTTQNAGSNTSVDSDANPGTGLTRTIMLGDLNTALTHDYTYQQVSATQGIDPTWDAGVVLTSDNGSNQPTQPGDNNNGTLPKTGASGGIESLAAALLLLGVGVLLRFGHRSRRATG